jgi:hypothetical protein
LGQATFVSVGLGFELFQLDLFILVPWLMLDGGIEDFCGTCYPGQRLTISTANLEVHN